MWDNHKFHIAIVHWHDAESAILVLKQGETCVSGDFLMINSAQAEIVQAKESSNVPESLL